MTARRLLRLALAVVATGWCAGELDAMAVLLGAATAPPPAPPLGGGAEVTTLDWNGVDPVTDKRYAEGYAEVLEFRGFSTGALYAQPPTPPTPLVDLVVPESLASHRHKQVGRSECRCDIGHVVSARADVSESRGGEKR